MSFDVILPLFPQFTLHELKDFLSRFNPNGLPIEVYMPTTREWSIIVNPEWPITMITGMRQILLSLRPDYTRQFRDKLRLDELLGRQPRRGPLTKRAAASDLVSPRKPKLLRSAFTSTGITPMITSPTPHDDTGTPDPPIVQNPPSSSLSGQLMPTTPTQKSQIPSPNESQPDKMPRFPAGFLAHDILKGTSRYILEREGKHGRFREVFQQVFGRNCSKTTEANLPKIYPKAYAHFSALDYNRQTTITWNELVKSCDNTTPSSPLSKDFIPFVDPIDPVHLQTLTPPPPTPNITTTNILTPITNLTSTLSLASPGALLSSPARCSLALDLPRARAQFPLDAETLEPLGADEQAVLDANVALIRATRAALGDGINTTDSGDDIPSYESVGLRCPFCDTELPGKQYSNVLLAILSSPKIQTQTVSDPTGENPNLRRSLIGHNAYSDFCAQHVLEELTPVAKLRGWPYPPDFSALPQRVREKEGFLNAVMIGITTGVEVSKFHSDLLSMNNKQRYDQSLNIISAG